MTHLESRDEALFSSDEVVDLDDYRQVSLPAVASLVLGFLSLAALIHVTFWVIPMAAIVLSVVALRGLARDRSFIGRKAALGGMALALFFGAMGPSQKFSREFWLNWQARHRAEAWFDLILSGHLEEAHQLTISYMRRASAQKPLEEVYAEGTNERSEFDEFASNPTINTLVRFRESGRCRFLGNLGIESQTYIEQVIQIYVFDYEEDGEAKSLPIRVTVARDFDTASKVAAWRIVEAVKDDTSGLVETASDADDHT